MTQQDGMQLRGGGQFSARPHLLTLDGQTVLVCHGNFVRAHSAVTGEPLYRLTGHTAEVTAVLADPDNAKRVYTSSLDGTLRHWDLRSGLALRTWRVPEPVESFALGPPGHAWLSCPVNDASGRLFRYDLTTGTPGPLRRKIASGSPLSVRGIGNRHYSLLRRAGAGAGVAVAATMTGPVAAADVDGDPVQSPAQGLSAMFAPEAAGQAGDKSLAQGTPLGSAAPWATLLDAPSHVLPSLDALCPAFLKLLLPEGEVV
ncbi:hypothetical protein APUTEX25_001430 [Auxenochlorella protothecoides]|uniref:Uncharacterized protein n=1 Tax=Auxenochlorella protothecoides TaxID=3075 RepID=A0A3M7L1B7_AUXPR|nr:hypothetical protein APUTEX25_001430 [Auxenochlorella protothecoides]|eukprot:RMZ56583.1 hypothetical protein APUTEX25_001430 [Auxenochlorella protothecoides]